MAAKLDKITENVVKYNKVVNKRRSSCSLEAAYNAMKRRGKIKDNFKILGIGGDGGTYDIGFQSLSGALERGHDFTYFCYDNNAYMNTGTQRSSATPRFASATTTPFGAESVGKKQVQKDLTQIVVAPGSKVSPFHLKLIVVVAELYHGILYDSCLYRLRAEKSCVTVSGNASRMFLSML